MAPLVVSSVLVLQELRVADRYVRLLLDGIERDARKGMWTEVGHLRTARTEDGHRGTE